MRGEGVAYCREVNGVEITVVSMIFNDRVCARPVGEPWYDRGFCYPKGRAATAAAEVWDGAGDPPGPWIKEVGTGRYGPGSRAYREAQLMRGAQ